MYQAAVLTISDKGSQGLREDKSGPAVSAFLQKNGYQVIYTTIIPDEKEEIMAKFRELAGQNIALIVTTGGTGFSKRDVTPEALQAVCQRMIPGFGEAMRSASSQITDRAWLSRACAGILDNSILIALPGSPKAAVENLEAIIHPLKHGLEILLGVDSECAAAEVLYKSTRGDGTLITSSQAILKGLADDGGLYVPNQIPKLKTPLEQLAQMKYQEVAYEVLRLMLTDYTENELKQCIENAYDAKFDTPEIAPVKKVGNAYMMELFHGATIAFKDMALSILPHLLTTAAKKNQITQDIVILTATSGDTGKAALAGFANVPHTRIIVFYPKGGVSRIQELQMITQKGDNTLVVGVHGNFDDAQTGVKKMFNDEALKQELKENGFQFSSANSINIGRLVPQIAYYVWAYTRLVKEKAIKAGDEINFVVPTGNFGNILAGYYAKEMGLPVKKLICASNDNKVLYDFFNTGAYDRKREFILTSSPSMDILISSNLERLIYKIAGESESRCRNLMKELTEDGAYTITADERKQLEIFRGGYADEAENAACIRATYEKTGYVTDTHTGVANCVYQKYIEETHDETPTVIVSTASPYKFSRSVMNAIRQAESDPDDFVVIKELEKTSGVPIPPAVKEIMDAQIMHDHVCEIDEMEQTVKQYLGLQQKRNQ